VTQTVVIIDDQSTGRLILAEVVKGIDRAIQAVMFSNPVEAIEYIRQFPVDLVLTDYKMPQLDGVETIRQLRGMYTYQQLPIVMTTVVSDREVRYSAFEVGATDFLIRPVDPIECRARCQNLLNLRQQYLINSNHTRIMEARVLDVTRELRLLEVDTLCRLARAAEKRELVSGAHLLRLSAFAALIARSLGLSDDEVEAIELAAPMHDIGKICIPDAIMQNAAELTPQEAVIMQTHAHLGHDLLKNSPSRFLQVAARIALHHHQEFDGSGYPGGLAGHAIPLEARIVAVADVFDTLTTAQSGVAPMEWRAALDYLLAHRGLRFDPVIVDAFVAHTAEIEAILDAATTPSPSHG
jgi:two-component system response regulator RpfG